MRLKINFIYIQVPTAQQEGVRGSAAPQPGGRGINLSIMKPKIYFCKKTILKNIKIKKRGGSFVRSHLGRGFCLKWALDARVSRMGRSSFQPPARQTDNATHVLEFSKY